MGSKRGDSNVKLRLNQFDGIRTLCSVLAAQGYSQNG